MNARFREHIANHDLISFDVFDTLILRAIEKPTDVFALIKMKLLTTQVALLNPDTIDAFPDLRAQAERLARETNHHRGGHGEVTFDEIYEAFARLSHADPGLISLF